MFFKSYCWRTRLLSPSFLAPPKNYKPDSWFLFVFPIELHLLVILMIRHLDSTGCSTKPCHTTGGNPNSQQHHMLFPFSLWMPQHMLFPALLLRWRQARRTGRWHPPSVEQNWLVSCQGPPFERLFLHLVAQRILTVKITTPWNNPSFHFRYLPQPFRSTA